MTYKDMFTVLVVDSRLKRSRSLSDAFERILGTIAYLKLFEESYAHFPGFANEIQGVFPEEDPGGRVRLFTYVIRE
jgi:Orn/Lys/Arg decarboxylase, C-terminal domain